MQTTDPITINPRVAAMARAMLAAYHQRGRCYAQDLHEAGFTPAEIEALGDQARAEAARLRAAGEIHVTPVDLRKEQRRLRRYVRRALVRSPHNDVRWGGR